MKVDVGGLGDGWKGSPANGREIVSAQN